MWLAQPDWSHGYAREHELRADARHSAKSRDPWRTLGCHSLDPESHEGPGMLRADREQSRD